MQRLIFPLLLWLSASAALAVQDCEVNGQSVNPANGFTTQGKTGLMRCRDRDSGQLVREEELKGGKFIGLVRHYENGKLIRERSVNDKGNSEGRDRERTKEFQREYHDSGALTREQRWGPEGLASDKTWYLNCQPRKEHRYVRQEGRAVCLITEYHDNGKPKIEGSYAVERGALTQALGLWRYHDVEGRLRKEIEYDAKGRAKRERELNEQGKVVRDDGLFEDGSRKAYAAPR